jgi:hypothetical protein
VSGTVRTGWGFVAILLALWLIIASIGAAVHSSHFHKREIDADHRAHFYRVIGGEEDGSALTVENKLALDVKRAIAQHRLNRFRGDSNAYGGVTDALGVDPFDGSCGDECGFLTPSMKSNVLRAASGDADAVVSSDRPHDSGGPSIGIPGLILAVWFVLGVAIMASPFIQRRRKQETIRERYPAEARLLARFNNTLRELPPSHPEYQRIRGLRDGLQEELTERMSSGEEAVGTSRLEYLCREGENTLEALREGNRALDT